MTTVRLAIVGGGVIGRRHAGAIAAVDNAELAAIADPAASGRELAEEHAVSVYDTIEALLESETVDGVVVSTPTAHHFQPTMTALEHGRHVLVEKPIMASLEEAEKVADKAAASDLHVLVGHHRRYYGLVHKAREIIGSGELGRLVALSGLWSVRKADGYYDPDWRKKWEAGPILTNLIHEMDLLRFICGEVESISAEVSHTVRGWEKEDAAALVIRFASGALGTFVLSDQATSPWAWELATGETAFFPKTGQNAIRFMGTEAALDFPNLTLWRHGDGPPDWNHTISPTETALPLEDAFVRQIAHFADVITGIAAPVITAADGAATLRATLAVYEAAQSGRRVTL